MSGINTGDEVRLSFPSWLTTSSFIVTETYIRVLRSSLGYLYLR